MNCNLDNCRDSILLGVLTPLGICLALYAGLFAYAMYLTDQYHVVDIKHWKNERLSRISSRYASEIRDLNREIRQLGGTPDE